MENKMIKKYFSTLGFRMFLGIIVIYAVQIICGAIVGAINPELMQNFDIAMLVSMIPMYLIGFPVLIVLVKKVEQQKIEEKSMSGNDFVKAMFISYALIIIGNLFGLGITAIIALIKGESVINPIVDIVSEGNIFLTFIYTGICAPIFEEIVFRKLLIDRTVKYGEKTAIILSGVAFGLFHGNLNQFVYAMIIGMFFAFVYAKTGKLKYCIILHMFINFVGGTWQIIISTYFNGKTTIDNIVNTLNGFLILAMVITGVVLLIKSRKRFVLQSGEVEIEKGKLFNTVFLNAGMLFYSLFFIAYMIVLLIV